GAFGQLTGEAVAEQVDATRLEVAALAGQAARGQGRQVGGGPDLAVGVRVAGPHHLALVLEDLHVDDVFPGGEVRRFLRPGVDDRADLGRRHQGEGEVVSRREAQDPADAAHPTRDEEAV